MSKSFLTTDPMTHSTTFKEQGQHLKCSTVMKEQKKKREKKGQYLPSMPTIMTVLWAPNATKNLESSGTRN